MAQKENKVGSPDYVAVSHFIWLEAMLIRSVFGSGVTALREASCGKDGNGNYYVALFGMSTGIERLAKLILVIDYILNSNGKMPESKFLQRKGHKIAYLIKCIKNISNGISSDIIYPYPKNIVTESIILNLDSFSGLNHKYTNLDVIGDTSNYINEPIKRWRLDVGEKILQLYYDGTPNEDNVNALAAERKYSKLENDYPIFHNEMGDEIITEWDSFIYQEKVKVIQQQGQLNALKIMRWMVNVYDVLSRRVLSRAKKIHFQFTWSVLKDYLVSDLELKDKKIWP